MLRVKLTWGPFKNKFLSTTESIAFAFAMDPELASPSKSAVASVNDIDLGLEMIVLSRPASISLPSLSSM